MCKELNNVERLAATEIACSAQPAVGPDGSVYLIDGICAEVLAEEQLAQFHREEGIHPDCTLGAAFDKTTQSGCPLANSNSGWVEGAPCGSIYCFDREMLEAAVGSR
ncbi:hypothetical protein COY16_02370 [Candidatus Roizmanbacteria bacterium CG_4_10_14_0_2_um_filter_39_13]|uniref:Uncharacterized protein n=1 Tax=Candidatus Roizmanbacteria bacterium CG_4_10_14_0_2_um_filter_39_13 TaxID=1974825 RepID=A0A2M7TZV0_9BACT|nr:MAG: hypothetical protein COY16_02370 [Candidatus Roizmanbacteria bacterium CG_4_10_14_0_2_um_filter_39_13]